MLLTASNFCLSLLCINTDYSHAAMKPTLDLSVPAAGIKIDTSAAEFDTVHTVPGMQFAQATAQLRDIVAATASNGGMVPAVVVSPNTATASALSMPTLAAGSKVPITLSGFSPNKPVSFEITKKCLSTKDGVDAGSFTPNTASEVGTSINLPASLSSGTYSVKATQQNLVWCSQPFDVKA